MNRRLFAPALAGLLLAAALPAARADETRPEEAAAQDVVFLADGRPLLIRFDLRLDGRPFRAAWEKFLNGDSPKKQLMARYLYEHWFIADLFFSDDPAATTDADTDVEPRHFFQIVRSRTPPGQPVVPIATTRPSFARHCWMAEAVARGTTHHSRWIT